MDTPTQREAAAISAVEQAMLRVAQLVSDHGPREKVFALVTEELSRLLGVDLVRTSQYDPRRQRGHHAGRAGRAG